MTRWGHSFANALPWRSRPIMVPLLSLAYGILGGQGVAVLFIIGYSKAWSCQLVIKDNNDPDRTIQWQRNTNICCITVMTHITNYVKEENNFGNDSHSASQQPLSVCVFQVRYHSNISLTSWPSGLSVYALPRKLTYSFARGFLRHRSFVETETTRCSAPHVQMALVI